MTKRQLRMTIHEIESLISELVPSSETKSFYIVSLSEKIKESYKYFDDKASFTAILNDTMKIMLFSCLNLNKRESRINDRILILINFLLDR